MAAAKEISVGAAIAAVLSELGGIFLIKRRTQKQEGRLFSADNIACLYFG